MAGKRVSDGPPPRQQRQSLILVYLNSINKVGQAVLRCSAPDLP
ncbi:hypothetical protein PVAP13_9NG672698 [Panicum virgatum]|uniref:Uncharacterized protein n=1 Tax=Panicum virgatum TaxID=38727 RepID=A0A8T0MX44_PANVG|nr:hypothetical protein PVAP13_9NG672698 [Panicum virgatum]